MAVVQILPPVHTSPETAYVIADYPYGFTLRCQMRIWIETNGKKGQRVVTQTSNPKRPGLVWNKPKASTYSLLKVLFVDEQGHVQNDALSPYIERETLEAFFATYGEGLQYEHAQSLLKGFRAAFDRRDARKAAAAAQQAPAASEPLKLDGGAYKGADWFHQD